MADTVERALDAALDVAVDVAVDVEVGVAVDVPAALAPSGEPVFSTRTPSGSATPVRPAPPAARAAVPARGALVRLATSSLTWLGVAGTVLATLLVLGATDTPRPVPSAAAVQEVPPPLPQGPRVRTGMLAAGTWTGTATYQLFTSAPVAAATVVVVRSGDLTRVDVVTGTGAATATASLLRTGAGWVACSTAGTSECLLVAAPGALLPAAFDPGVGALLTSALPAMAGLPTGVAVTRSLDPGTDLAGAQCAAVTTGPVPGEYCLTDAGLLRRAVFGGGKLNLTAATSAVDPAALVPPATPVPLA